MLIKISIIKKLKGGKYRLYSRKKDKSGHRRNLGTYDSLEAVKNREKQVQFFKHQADDGKNEDKETKLVSKLSNIATYLEKAGYISAADKVYCAMDAVDGSFDSADDSIVSSTPDVQNALPGSMDYMMTGEVAGGMQGAFSIPEAEKVAALANKLDEKGLYDEADELDEILMEMLSDDMPEIIENLEEKQEDKKKKRVKPEDEDKDKAGVGVLVDSNGHVGTGVTDNQNSGMFSGFSDSYFYSGYGNLEGAYGG